MASLTLTPTGIEFFAKFARFEYALKRAGFCRLVRDDVIVCWEDFTDLEEINDLWSTLSTDQHAKYLIETPPRKRTLENGALGWTEQPPPLTTMRAVGVMLRRVRNNFFHGDKQNLGSERNERLLWASIVILDKMLAAQDAIRIEFESD